jgi:hypothetical protein
MQIRIREVLAIIFLYAVLTIVGGFDRLPEDAQKKLDYAREGVPLTELAGY